MSIAEKFEIISDAVYEKSKADERKHYWGVRQNNGNPTNYVYAFYGANWNDDIYNPQFDFVVQSNANSMYYGSYITDTKKLIDISGEGIGGNTASMFQNSKLKKIFKLKLKENGTNNLSKCFDGCTELEEIEIEGKIGKNADFSDCPLNVKSLKNIIEQLMDYSAANAYTYTVTFNGNAFNELEKEGATAKYNGTPCTWAELIDNKKWNLVKASEG